MLLNLVDVQVSYLSFYEFLSLESMLGFVHFVLRLDLSLSLFFAVLRCLQESGFSFTAIEDVTIF